MASTGVPAYYGGWSRGCALSGVLVQSPWWGKAPGERSTGEAICPLKLKAFSNVGGSSKPPSRLGRGIPPSNSPPRRLRRPWTAPPLTASVLIMKSRRLWQREPQYGNNTHVITHITLIQTFKCIHEWHFSMYLPSANFNDMPKNIYLVDLILSLDQSEGRFLKLCTTVKTTIR